MHSHARFARRSLSLGVAILGTVLVATPARLSASPSPTSAQSTKIASKQAALTPADNVAARIKRLHDQLQITPDQETLWTSVAGVMNDNAKAISDAMEARSAKLPTMNAVDDIQSYGAVAEAHAEGLKKLAAAFAPLYAAMPPAQQLHANSVFAHKPAPPRKG